MLIVRAAYNGVSRHVFRTNTPLGLFYDPSTFCFRRMMRILHCQLRREINAKELLQFRFILPPKSESFFTKLVNLRVLESPQSAESSMYQPVAIGIYIAQENDGRAIHADDSRIG